MLQGHQDCPPKAQGEQCASVAACGLPGMASHAPQAMQPSSGRVVAAVVVVVEEVVILS